MGNKFPPFYRLMNKVIKRNHRIHTRLPSLTALLHGRDNNSLYPVETKSSALRILAIQEGQLIKAQLRGFLCHPFHTVSHLCRRNGKMNMRTPGFLLRKCLHDAIRHLSSPSSLFSPPFGEESGVGHYLCTKECPLAVHQINLIAATQSQHTKGMHGLILRKLRL